MVERLRLVVLLTLSIAAAAPLRAEIAEITAAQQYASASCR